jgi:hypothetical protein
MQNNKTKKTVHILFLKDVWVNDIWKNEQQKGSQTNKSTSCKYSETYDENFDEHQPSVKNIKQVLKLIISFTIRR